MFFLFEHFVMAYVVKGFHLCPADSCSPGAVLPQHTGYNDSSLNRDSSDPFLWFFSPFDPSVLEKSAAKDSGGFADLVAIST